MMSTYSAEDNKKVIEEYFTGARATSTSWVHHKVDKLCAPDYLIHYPMHGPVVSHSKFPPPDYYLFMTDRKHGREASKKMLTDFRTAFPDLTFWAVGPLIAENTPEGEFVVGRWDGGGTHTGPAFADLALGKLDDANTGKKMRFTGTTVFRMEGGRIKEEIGEEGALRACSQLGLVGPLRWT